MDTPSLLPTPHQESPILFRPDKPKAASSVSNIQAQVQSLIKLPEEMTFDLRVLQEGSSRPASDDISEDTEDNLPPDFDLEKFNRGRRFFINNVGQCMSAMFCSLVCGLSVNNLLRVLVKTGETCRPWASMERYIQTGIHILKWHYGNVWERNSSARRSIRAVRKLHNNARKLMVSADKEANDTRQKESSNEVAKDDGLNALTSNDAGPSKHVTQYDMSLVQCGFIGIIIMYPRKFGIKCSEDDLDDYVYFWRCIGYLLGINDHNNICVGGYERSYRICKTIEKDVLLPSLQDSPREFYPMAKALTDGINMLAHFSFTTPEAQIAFGLDACGERNAIKIRFADKIRFYFCKMMVKSHLYIPGFTRVVRKIVEVWFGCNSLT